MALKQLLGFASVVLMSFALTCTATTYIVGDNSGWDISTDLNSWATGKQFSVGDVLMFQYSSSHSLNEVTKENFDACNTTNVVKAFTNGNTTVTLSKPGSRYFLCGNKLHCLGGMKLQVNVESNQAFSPAGAPQSTSGGADDLPNQPSSKSNNNIPTSSGFKHGGMDPYMIAFLGFVSTVFWVAS